MAIPSHDVEFIILIFVELEAAEGILLGSDLSIALKE
jgi:hypothetical protein